MEKEQGGLLVSLQRVRFGKKAPIEFIPRPRDDSSGACFPICKLSTKLSTRDWADVARHQLTGQVHQRHVLTLWDTT